MALPLANPPFICKDPGASISLNAWNLQRLLQTWHLASLDAPAVAVAWALAFGWAARIQLEPWVLLLLACGTFSVYVGDRLLDARRAIASGELSALRDRHFFHWRHRRTLLPLAVLSALVAVVLIIQLMPAFAREGNSVLAAAALMYFSGVHTPAKRPAWMRSSISKESLVGVLFTAGCAAPTLTRMQGNVNGPHWPLFACLTIFAALAWLNCAAIERWESAARNRGTTTRAGLLASVALLFAFPLAFTDARISALLFAAASSALLLALLDRMRERLSPLNLRASADLALLAPLILVACGARIG